MYRSVKRMDSDTTPAKMLQKQGHRNVLVNCFMKGLNGVVIGDRASVVRKCLRWNSRKQSQNIKWKETETKLMRNENLRWRRELIAKTVTKTRGSILLTHHGSGART